MVVGFVVVTALGGKAVGALTGNEPLGICTEMNALPFVGLRLGVIPHEGAQMQAEASHAVGEAAVFDGRDGDGVGVLLVQKMLNAQAVASTHVRIGKGQLHTGAEGDLLEKACDALHFRQAEQILAAEAAQPFCQSGEKAEAVAPVHRTLQAVAVVTEAAQKAVCGCVEAGQQRRCLLREEVAKGDGHAAGANGRPVGGGGLPAEGAALVRL